MNLVTLETALLRAALTLVRRALRDVYLPDEAALEPYQLDVRRVLERLDDLETALVRLDVAVDRDRLRSMPF